MYLELLYITQHAQHLRFRSFHTCSQIHTYRCYSGAAQRDQCYSCYWLHSRRHMFAWILCFHLSRAPVELLRMKRDFLQIHSSDVTSNTYSLQDLTIGYSYSYWVFGHYSPYFYFKTLLSGDWILSELSDRMSYQRHVGGFFVFSASDVQCIRQDFSLHSKVVFFAFMLR